MLCYFASNEYAKKQQEMWTTQVYKLAYLTPLLVSMPLDWSLFGTYHRCLVTLVMFGLSMCYHIIERCYMIHNFASMPDPMSCCQHKGVWYHWQLYIGYSCIITSLICLIWLITFLDSNLWIVLLSVTWKTAAVTLSITSTLYWKFGASDSHQLFHTYIWWSCCLFIFSEIPCMNHVNIAGIGTHNCYVPLWVYTGVARMPCNRVLNDEICYKLGQNRLISLLLPKDPCLRSLAHNQNMPMV